MRVNPAAPRSKHLTGQAADIADADGKLKAWLLAYPEHMESIGLWAEDASHTKGWVHLQSCPPASGKRWFIP